MGKTRGTIAFCILARSGKIRSGGETAGDGEQAEGYPQLSLDLPSQRGVSLPSSQARQGTGHGARCPCGQCHTLGMCRIDPKILRTINLCKELKSIPMNDKVR